MSQSKGSRMSLDQLFQRMQQGTAKELNLILKADVQGSVEVLGDTMRKLSTSEVKVNVIHSSVGAISTNDILLASDADASRMSFVEIAPTEEWMTLTLTSEVESLRIVSPSTSTEPCTSALRMRLSSLAVPCCMRWKS